MLTTSELFTQVISQSNWYEPLNISKQYAYNLKIQFSTGELSEAKQQEVLLKLGFEIEQPTIWKKNRSLS